MLVSPPKFFRSSGRYEYQARDFKCHTILSLSQRVIDGVRPLPKHGDGIYYQFKEDEGHAGNGTGLSIFVWT